MTPLEETLVNVFTTATIKQFRQVTGQELNRIACFHIEGEGRVIANIATIYSFTGEVKGQLVLIMDESMALQIASAILMGMPVTEFDEMAESSVCEMGNMIGGEAARQLVELGYTCDLSVPSIVRGLNMELGFYPREPKIMMKFASALGPISVLIRLDVIRKAPATA